MRTFFFLCTFLMLGQLALAQDSSRTNYRYFIDFTLLAGMNDPLGKPYEVPGAGGGVWIENGNSFVGGLQGKMGNNWYLDKGKFHGILKLTWLRGGLFAGEDGNGLFISPLNVGVGHRFLLTENISIDPSVSFAGFLISDDLLAPDWYITAAFVPELAVNFRYLSFAFEYSHRSYVGYYSNDIAGYYRYLGFSLRVRA